MTARYLGSLTIGGALPGASIMVAAGLSGISASLPELQAKLAALLNWTPSEISIIAQIGQLQTMITALQVQLSLGVPPPSLTTQLAELARLAVEIRAAISQLETQRALLVDAQQVLATAGVHAISFAGRADRLGIEVGGALSSVPGISPADATQAITLATTVPAVFAALASIMKVG